jgi:hypothetical protein
MGKEYKRKKDEDRAFCQFNEKIWEELIVYFTLKRRGLQINPKK